MSVVFEPFPGKTFRFISDFLEFFIARYSYCLDKGIRWLVVTQQSSMDCAERGHLQAVLLLFC